MVEGRADRHVGEEKKERKKGDLLKELRIEKNRREMVRRKYRRVESSPENR